MKTNENVSSEGGPAFGFESLQAELMRTSDEILWDIKADIDPFITAVEKSS